MILGDLIKQYREENNCSMSEFAKKAHLSKAYISILERNINPVNNKPIIPSLETIKAVSSAVGLDFNDVIAMLDANQKVALNTCETLTGSALYTQKEELHLKKYRAIPDSSKETVDFILDKEYERFLASQTSEQPKTNELPKTNEQHPYYAVLAAHGGDKIWRTENTPEQDAKARESKKKIIFENKSGL